MFKSKITASACGSYFEKEGEFVYKKKIKAFISLSWKTYFEKFTGRDIFFAIIEVVEYAFI